MSPQDAIDAMYAVVKTAWDATGFTIVWTDVPGSVPAESAPWARPTVTHATGGQSSLAGATGTKRWTATGTLTVQVFAPVGDGRAKAYELAHAMMLAFRTATGPVWYRNHRLKEVGNDGAFEQINVMVDFNYDDFT
jgi:hypothetical protein